ncbi:hypothetical protein PFISCL1PPCAC_10127 [Pristionchus fissidentatus]|uniref:CX domain-containing protein n=1 Tax=Pristionchus fissidentatus TaxID=1538716 RepID=A0AAV5VGM9_9BILA|nr:hypothetical protein PFISCL1PPCAC_10127 [Pristionchus fissidentatus]
MGGSSGGKAYTPKSYSTSSIYRSGSGSVHSSTAAKAAVAAAAAALISHEFDRNVLRDYEKPMKADGVSYFWSPNFVPQTASTFICSLPIDTNDTLFNHITFPNLEKVTDLAWSCSSSSYCCGLNCCHSGYEGTPFRIVGTLGVILLSLSALLIPGVVIVKGGQRADSTNDLK